MHQASHQDMDQLNKDHALASKISDWQQTAYDGAATSAFAPQLETPSPRLVANLEEVDTPPKIPRPMRKAQLACSKRVEKALKAAKTKGETNEKPQGKPKGNNSKEKEKAKKIKEKEKAKKIKDKKEDKKETNGPMKVAMAEYVAKCRAEGMTYAQAMAGWKLSSERKAIVDTMSPSEQKRRKY